VEREVRLAVVWFAGLLCLLVFENQIGRPGDQETGRQFTY